MELNLNNTVQIIAIISFTSTLVKYLIVNPLQTAITTLNDAIKEIKKIHARLEEEQRNIDKRLVAVEESTKSAHKRIDGMESAK